MTALAEIHDLSVHYRRDGTEVTALKGISLCVVAGERLAIIGESGSGKSTLALAIAGLLPASARIEGKIDWFLGSTGEASAKAPPSALPGISPSRGEIVPSSPLSTITSSAGRAPSAKLPISPLEGEMSGRTEGGVTERRTSATGGPRQPLPGRDIGFIFQDPSASLDPVMPVG